MNVALSYVAARDDLHREIARLREENETLQQEVRAYRALLAPRMQFPSAWRLAPQEKRFLACLLGAEDGFRTKAALHVAIANTIEIETSERLVTTIAFKTRRKLPSAIRIETVWGEGFRLPLASRMLVSAACRRATAPAPVETAAAHAPEAIPA